MKKNIFPRIISLLLAVSAVASMACVPAAAADLSPAVSSNVNKHDYFANYGATVDSYLYENPAGGLTRVEYLGDRVIVEDYSSAFALQSSRTILVELPLWGGFFAGAQYNFLIFGQRNPAEQNDVEVIRVVKYSKDWKRLGQTSVRGANTTIPFDAGSLRCAEADGVLYIRTCHQMFRAADGLNHQANMMLTVRQRDMALTSNFCKQFSGYTSHSFNQYILVDSHRNIVTVDHGDGYPRSFRLFQLLGKGGTADPSATGVNQSSGARFQPFPGQCGENFTGAQLGGLAETANGYLTAYSYNGGVRGAASNVYIAYTPKSKLVPGQTSDESTGITQVTYDADASAQRTSCPVLAPTSSSGGYLLWNTSLPNQNPNWVADGQRMRVNSGLHYARYDGNGVLGQEQAASGADLSDCQPILYRGDLVWYTTDNSAPVFYTLNEKGVTATPANEAGKLLPDAGVNVPTPPTANPGDPSVAQKAVLVDAGYNKAAAIDQNGGVWTWGGLREGTPRKVLDNAVSVAAGNNFFLALKQDGTVWSWGGNYYGELGDGTKEDRSTPKQILSDVAAISAAPSAAGALKKDGTLWLWGHNNDGMFGIGSVDNVFTSPVQVADQVASFDLGVANLVTVKMDGSLWVSGRNYNGQMGIGSLDYRPHPVPVKIMDDVVSASIWFHGAAMKTDGSVWVWGDNYVGQANANTKELRILRPTKLMDGAVQVSAGYACTAVVKADGTLWLSGNNFHGMLGLGSTDRNISRAPFQCMDGVVSAVAGGDTILVRKQDGSVWSWGNNQYGLVGNGNGVGNARDEFNYVLQTVPTKVLTVSK